MRQQTIGSASVEIALASSNTKLRHVLNRYSGMYDMNPTPTIREKFKAPSLVPNDLQCSVI